MLYKVSCDEFKYPNLVGYIINHVTFRFLWLTLCLNTRSASLLVFVRCFSLHCTPFLPNVVFFFQFIFALILSLA